MKKFTIFITTLLLCMTSIFAQAPQKFSYQAVVRNASNALVTNAPVGVRISVLQGGVAGTLVYMETHTAVTNENGLMTLSIGSGNLMQGDFASIDWANGLYYLKSEIDPTGGTNYSITSIQQLLSVPYALYANESGNGFSGDYNDLLNTPTIPSVPTNVSAFANDAGYLTSFTEQQVLSISHDTVFLTGGSFVKLPAGFDGDYNSLINRPTLFSGNYNDLSNTPAIPTVPTNVSAFNNDAGYITGYTETDPQFNAWDKDYNDLINKPYIPNVPTNVSSFNNDAGYLTGYTETDPQFNAWDKNYYDLTNRPQIPQIPTNISTFTNDIGYITNADVPTNVSAFTNDAGYITNVDVPTNVSAFTNDAGYITGYTETDPQFNAWDKDYNDLINKPVIPTVPANVSAFTNDAGYITGYTEADPQFNAWDKDYNDLTNKPTIPTVPTNVSAFANDAGYITSSQVPAQVNADWNATNGAAQILNKPTLFSGNYNDLTNKPIIPTVPTNVSAFTNDAGYLTGFTETDPLFNAWNKNYNDLINKPVIPTVPTNVSAFANDAGYITSSQVPAQVNADWNATNGAAQIMNKPTLFSGNYNDLTNKPTIPTVPTNVSAFNNDVGYITSANVPTVPANLSAFNNDVGYVTSVQIPAQVNADWNATTGAAKILNKPTIPTVPSNVSAFANDAGYITSANVPTNVSAFTNDAGYITTVDVQQAANIPTNVSAFNNDANYITAADIPAQVNADWNATSGAAKILNKPTLFSGNYNDLTNKPTIPAAANNATLNIQRNGTSVGTFTANASTNKTINITVPTTTNELTNNSGFITANQIPAQVNADWNATSGAAQILNKPTIPSIPTNVSVFNNDANYITNTGNTCDNTIDLCNLLSTIESLQNQVQELASMTGGNPYGTASSDTCPERMVVIDGNPNVCYFGPEFANTQLTVWVDGGYDFTADYIWFESGQYRPNVLGSGNSYVETWTPTYNNPLQFTVKVTFADGCSYISAPFKVNVYDRPYATITGDNEICSGEEVELRANLQNYNDPMITYQWYENTVNSGHALTGRTHGIEHFEPASTTDYIVKVTHLMNYNPYVDYCVAYDTFRVEVTECDTAGGGTDNPQMALPTVTTDSVTVISTTSANCYGNVASEGGAVVTARGVCWSTLHNPTISDNHTSDSVGTGYFNSNLTGLTAGTYYVRAYATNSVGTAYGEEMTLTLYLVIPKSGTYNHTMTNNMVSVYDHAGPDANYDNSCDGTLIITTPNEDMLLSVSGSYNTESNFDKLFIFDGDGTSNLLAILSGNNNISPPIITSQNSVTLSFTSDESVIKSGLELVVNAIPTTAIPTVTTDPISNITDFSATCGGFVSTNSETTITARGVCWSTSHNPTLANNHTTDGGGTGSFLSSLTGLESNVTYYVKAYATSNYGTFYGDELNFTTLDNSAGDAQPCPGTPTVSDVDGNTYNTVKIGEQCWMKENLRTTRYANGAAIIQGTTSSSLTQYWYYPNDDASNKSIYGLLYNWSAVMNGATSSDFTPSMVQGVCPSGWHVPSDAEWTKLSDYLGGHNYYRCGSQADYISKALADTGSWNSSTNYCSVGYNSSSNNTSGFSAIPAGNQSSTSFGNYAFFWTSTKNEYDSSSVKITRIDYNNSRVIRYSQSSYYRCSVRCLRDEHLSGTLPTVTTNMVSNIMFSSAIGGGVVMADSETTVTARGVCWSTIHNPTLNENLIAEGNGTGSFICNLTGLESNKTYYLRAYAICSFGTIYGNEVSFTTPINNTGDSNSCPGIPTVTDVEGNSYNTLLLGGQCWLRENLRTTQYADGTAIAQDNYSSSITGQYYYPNGDESYKQSYGLLYNWPAVMRDATSNDATPSGVQGICPDGWHVPSNAEWNQLVVYVSSQSQYWSDNDSSRIAKALASTCGWKDASFSTSPGYNQNSNNSTGFDAMPAGHWRSGYIQFHQDASFWTSLEQSSSSAYYRYISSTYDGVGLNSIDKSDAFSVRCIHDEQQSQYFPTVSTNTASNVTSFSAICGGNVTATNAINVTAYGVCWSTKHYPTIYDNKTMNGSGTGSFTGNLSNLMSNITYYVRAYAICPYGTVYGNEISFTTPINSSGDEHSCPGTPTVTDVEGNIYGTVQIGGLCWMRENLRTTHYSDGNAIAHGNYASYTNPYWYYPADDSTYKQTYGLLYNWSAVMNGNISSNSKPSGVQGICPTGWHVPSNAEWTYLTQYLSGQNQFVCGNSSSNIAKALAASTGWRISDYTCDVGEGQNDNNATGFSAFPTGCMDNNGSFSDFSINTFLWGSTDNNSTFACALDMYYYNSNVYLNIYNKSFGFPVRCLRDPNPVSDALPCPGVPTVSDHEGNVYNTVQIGDQCWTRENLRTTTSPSTGTYLVPPPGTNFTFTGKQAVWYNNDSATYAPQNYGLLYNWNAAMDTFNTAYGETSVSTNFTSFYVTFVGHRRGICPIGWHLPSDDEWTQLTDYLSNCQNEYGDYIYRCEPTTYNTIAKALASITGWDNGSDECTPLNQSQYINNASGFGAIPAGRCSYSVGNGFCCAGTLTGFWTATDQSGGFSYIRYFGGGRDVIKSGGVKYDSYSVRCLRD